MSRKIHGPIHTALSISAAIRCGQRFPRVLLFLWESPPRVPCEVVIAAEGPCSAASALCPVRVARVSRLIGISDTTANSLGWQVSNPQGLRRCFPSSPCRVALVQAPKAQTPLLRSGACFPALVTGLPAKCVAGGFPPCLPQSPPTGISLVLGRFLADALAGSLLFSGLAGFRSSSQSSLAAST
jgi:hypothetical protein